MKERKRQLLTRLEEFFKNDEDIDEVSFFTSDETGAPMDVLRLLLTNYGPGRADVLAEFSFLPFEGPEEVLYFSSVVTILTTMPKDAVPAVAGAIARLNFYLPYGSFGINSEGNMLIYKSVATLRADHDDKILYESMELAADTSLLIPEQSTYDLIRIAFGELLLNEYLEKLPK